MNIKVGLVGLPNVGKSSLFNALTKSSVPAENYPFCTIDPHVAITFVPDARMDKLQSIYDSKKQIPATVSFVDIAGLVKGAAQGQGLGNQFLGNIREVNLILHVLRCFEDVNIIKEGGDKIDPILDYEIIINELMLKDLEGIQKRLEKIAATLKKQGLPPQEKKDLTVEQSLLTDLLKYIDNLDVQSVKKAVKECPVQTIPLLSAKNFIIIANISEEDIANPLANKYVQQLVQTFGSEIVIPVSVRTELELSILPNSEKQDFMDMLNLKQSALQTVIEQSFKNLGMITFFTCGPQEIHAWPIVKGITVRSAAGEIHSDLERGFICAEIFNYHDVLQSSLKALRETGKVRTEGKDYIVQDGDIILVKFNV